MRAALLASFVLVLPFVSACDDHDALPPPAIETSESNVAATTIAVDYSRCEFALDAIGFTCNQGRILSVRHDPEMGCVIVQLEDGMYALPRDTRSQGYRFQDGEIVFERGDPSTFTRPGDTPYEGCVMDGKP